MRGKNAVNPVGLTSILTMPQRKILLSKSDSSLNALAMLQTHLDELGNALFSKPDKDGKIAAERLDSCFLCEKINWGMDHMIDTIFITFEKDRDFRNMFAAQPTFCLPHYKMLLARSKKSGLKRYLDEFRDVLKKITKRNLDELSSDLKHFCSMFDYRNNGSDNWGNSKTAIERTVKFRSGENR